MSPCPISQGNASCESSSSKCRSCVRRETSRTGMEAQELGKQLWKCNVGKKGLKLSTVTARRKKKKHILLISSFLFCIGGGKKKTKHTRARRVFKKKKQITMNCRRNLILCGFRNSPRALWVSHLMNRPRSVFCWMWEGAVGGESGGCGYFRAGSSERLLP